MASTRCEIVHLAIAAAALTFIKRPTADGDDRVIARRVRTLHQTASYEGANTSAASTPSRPLSKYVARCGRRKQTPAMAIQHLLYLLAWTLFFLASHSEGQQRTPSSTNARMFVPQLKGLESATEEVGSNAVSESSPPLLLDATNLTEITNTLRQVGRDKSRPSASVDVPRSHPAQKEVVNGLLERQSCASGTSFYRCANGFTGCCSVDPCNPGATCPDGDGSTSATNEAQSTATTTTPAQESKADSTTDVSLTTTTEEAKTSGTTTAESQTVASSIQSASPSGSLTSTMSASNAQISATPAPNCPAGNGTTFTDSSKIAYKIHCNSDNTYSSFDSISVGTGGYDQCFSACSLSTKCAGFTFVGLDGGSCYLKSQMPEDSFEAKNGTNYISCSKVDPNAAAPSPSITAPASNNGGQKNNAGAVAGGVIGGIAFLALILVLIAWLARRRRKKIEEKRAAVTHLVHGPIETQQMLNNYNFPSNPGVSGTGHHGRSGSTAHDAFAPFGGSYYQPPHTRQRSVYQPPMEQQWV